MRIAPTDCLAAREAALRAALAARGLEGLVVTSLPNIAYLTGFFATAAALVVTPDGLVLVGDGRYAEALGLRRRDFPRLEVRQLVPGESYDDAVTRVLAPLAGLRVGFEAAHLSVRRHRYLLSVLGEAAWSAGLVGTDDLVESLRAVKDAWETGRLRDGAERLSSVAKCILSNVLAGRTEADVAAAIETELRRAGFERPAFDTIVAAGAHAASPHARAGQGRIEPGDLVVLDFGGVLDGYCTDLSRTVVAGHGGHGAKRRAIAQVVEAQAAAFASVRPGGRPEDVDAAARETLGRHGLAEAFTHGTGHGLGLEIHEAPRVSRARSEHAEPPLAAGMVLTLEPGIYRAGWGGVRVEDDVLVTAGGAEWLTDVPRLW